MVCRIAAAGRARAQARRRRRQQQCSSTLRAKGSARVAAEREGRWWHSEDEVGTEVSEVEGEAILLGAVSVARNET